MLPLLSITTFLPLLGALAILILRPQNTRTTYSIGIGASALAVITSLAIWLRGVGGSFNQIEQFEWIPSLGIAYRMGVDGISFPLVILTTVLFLTSLIYSVKIGKRANTYVMLFLLLETACLGCSWRLTCFCFISSSKSRW